MNSVMNDSPKLKAQRVMREHLLNGIWRPGERLPTEEQLASTLGISRPTVRHALAELEAQGLVENRGRRGRVAAGAETPAAGVMAGTLVVLTQLRHEASPTYHGGSIDAVESGVLDAAQGSGLNVLRLHRDRLTPATEEWLRGNPPAGLILTAEVAAIPEAVKAAAAMLAQGVPVVSNEVAAGLEDADLVLFDHFGGAQALTRWLLSRGCRRILPFWSTTSPLPWIAERERGYVAAMKEAGLTPLPPARVDLPARPEEPDEGILGHRVRHTLGYLYEHLCGRDAADAVMLLEDSQVYPFLGAARVAGWKVGEEGIRFSGFDDFWSECWERSIFPLEELATVDKQNYVAGQEMVRLAAGRLSGALDGSGRRVVVPCIPRLPEQAKGAEQ